MVRRIDKVYFCCNVNPGALQVTIYLKSLEFQDLCKKYRLIYVKYRSIDKLRIVQINFRILPLCTIGLVRCFINWASLALNETCSR